MLINKQKAAELLGVSARQIDVLRKDHGLPWVKVGVCVRFVPEELEAWIKSKTVSSCGATQKSGNDCEEASGA